MSASEREAFSKVQLIFYMRPVGWTSSKLRTVTISLVLQTVDRNFFSGASDRVSALRT
jgi:hypothetical protein